MGPEEKNRIPPKKLRLECSEGDQKVRQQLGVERIEDKLTTRFAGMATCRDEKTHCLRNFIRG